MITIVDYGVGNLNSILNMFKKVGVKAQISSNVEAVLQADKIVLPGMGHFDNCMLRFEQSGLKDAVKKKTFEEGVAILGICVGLQMFMGSSEEGVENGLGWIAGRTVKFKEQSLPGNYKVPNMGWLDVLKEKESPLLEDLQGARFYFAHSYYVDPGDADDILLSANYGYRIAVALEHKNIIGVQFHPEKSHRYGMKIFHNFSYNYR